MDPPCQIRKLYGVVGGKAQWLSVNGSECQCPTSTATEFLRCAKLEQMHQSVRSGITFNNNDTSVELVG